MKLTPGTLVSMAVLGSASVFGYIHYSYLPAIQVDLLTMQAVQGLRSAEVQIHAAALVGNVRAIHSEGLRTLNQKNPESVAKGISLLSKVAKKGDPEAALDLGRLYFHGLPGERPDYAQARAWLGTIADQLPAASYYLALMDKNGLAGPVDLGKASAELQFAAKGGIPDALFLLGNAYKSGNGIAKDDAEAVHCFQQAAAQEHTGALLALALAYQQGEMGLPHDEHQAHQLFALAHDAAQDPPRMP
jgi:TPR repeat protein